MDIRLTANDIRFFKENGFLIKRRVLRPELMAQAQEVFWAKAPAQLRKDDPATWIGPFREEYHLRDEEDFRGGYRWNLRHIGREPWMMDLIPRDPNVVAMAQQLLGPDLSAPERVRGIYTTLPMQERTMAPDSLHVDEHAFHLGIVGYLGAVVPNGGGFRIWPTSHRWFYYAYETQYKPGRTDRYAEIKAFFETQPSLECTGEAGDIVFWHHRLAHMAGRNYSRNLRQAVLYDFKRADLAHAQEEPPQADMWRDWPGCQA